MVNIESVLKQKKGVNVNKGELIDKIAASADISKADAGRALDATLSAISGSLQNAESVSLVGFGTFWSESVLPEMVEIRRLVRLSK